MASTELIMLYLECQTDLGGGGEGGDGGEGGGGLGGGGEGGVGGGGLQAVGQVRVSFHIFGISSWGTDEMCYRINP